MSAKTYYVSTTGNDSWNGLNPDKTVNDGPWKTITKANTTISAGDTVYIREGKYVNDFIKPSKSGTSENARILYKNYSAETVTITNADYGIQLQNKSYTTISGISFYNLDRFVIIKGGGHNIIEYCVFDSMRNYVTWSGSNIQESSQYNRIHHCKFSRWGIFDQTLARGAMLDLGSEADTTDTSDYNLIEDCEFHSGGHHLLGIFSKFNIIKNNYFENDKWYSGAGYRCIITDGKDSAINVLEGNRICWAGSKPEASGSSGFDLRYANFIIRFNCFYKNSGTGITIATVNETGHIEPHHNYIFNNVFFGNGTNPADNSNAAISFRAWNGIPSSIRRNVIKNNILYKNSNPYTAWEKTSLDSQVIVNNWEGAGNPEFIDTNALGPKIINKPDFHLSASSPCIDKGAFLTTITSQSGSGFSFKVDDARYFIDGWKIVDGDMVQLEGKSDRVRITNVNYETNTLTVDKSISWTTGQKIGLPYSGNSPDQGVYEYSVVQNNQKPINPVVQSKNSLILYDSKIRYTLTKQCSVTLNIYINSGRLIMRIFQNKQQPPGCYELNLNALNTIAKGVYYINLVTDKDIRTLKFVMIH